MAVPKRKTSRTTTKTRRTHKKLAPVNLSACPECGELTPSHRVCPKCGTYGGKQVIESAE